MSIQRQTYHSRANYIPSTDRWRVPALQATRVLLPSPGTTWHFAAVILWFCLLDTPWYSHWEDCAWSHFFSDMCIKLSNFFVKIILPLLLCGTEKENNCHPSEATGIFCYCRKGEEGNMVLCDNSSCKYGWFHFSCVNLRSLPDGAWFCPDCQL